ncbi:hypothetical protein BGZ96_008214 [Linnemannia gamsii]|uniref:Uncharacterized protein n=1 Tax=Linnemannia gamsii TaxID=64522 RepID=A0ABQ7JYW2_9FUNG|nr:hypothetical protein BGZ96_008214 [Linnemannia gamsii]
MKRSSKSLLVIRSNILQGQSYSNSSKVKQGKQDTKPTIGQSLPNLGTPTVTRYSEGLGQHQKRNKMRLHYKNKYDWLTSYDKFAQ